MAIIEIIISTVISTGIIAAFINHLYDKKLKTHEIKLQKYFGLIEQLAKFAGNEIDHDNLRKYLNEALIFASDGVVGEILRFNKKFAEQRQAASNGNFYMTAEELQPLLVAIRKDLYLKSKSIVKEGLKFFQKPKN